MADENLNLTPERGTNVWNEKQSPERESWKPGVGGAVMIAAGAAAAVVGGRMLYRAMRGSREDVARRGEHTSAKLNDIVNEESAQSFPASDSPSWTPTEGANVEKAKRWK